MFIKRFVILAIIFTLTATTAFAYNFANGSGTEEDPYQVANLADLIGLSLDSSLWDSCFEQTADIDATTTSSLNNGAGFSPIGVSINNSFTGSYNGNEFTISNLFIYRPYTDYVSLFGRIEDAYITNIGMVDNDITGQKRVGALVGHSHNSPIIGNCYATGTITGTLDYIGGLVGSSVFSPIIDCYASGSVNGGGYNTGGLTGYTSSYINNCYASSSVDGGSINIGGLVGYTSATAIINNSYATGPVSGGIRKSGGLIGHSQESIISNCYSTGVVIGTGDPYFGGLIGYREYGSVLNSFWDIQTSGLTLSQGGTGKTTQQMKTISTYLSAGWDFSNIWLINSNINSGYPFHIHNIFSKLSIPNYATNVSITPIISLEVIEEFGYFEFNFGETPNPEATIIPFSNMTNPISYTFTEPLEYFTDYYWSIRLYDSDLALTTLSFTFKTRPPFTGLGNEYSPYQIANTNDLIFLSGHALLWDKYFIQTADIDASQSSGFIGTSWFSPLGNDINNFTGSYNGNGYRISNLYVNRPNNDYVGFFGYISGASLSHISLVDNEVIGQGYVASLVGYTDDASVISNSYATGIISATGNYVGGLVAYSDNSTIINSYSMSSINGQQTHLGGLVAYSDNSPVINSFWDVETSGLTISAGGIGKTTLAMTNLYTFINAGWDFVEETTNGSEDIWNIHPNVNSGYPYLIPQQLIIPEYLPNFALSSYPNNGVTNLATEDNLVWQADYLQTALGYRLNMGTDNPPTDLVRNQDLGLTNLYNYHDLEANTTYYWQVIPYNTNGDAEDCPIWSFTTGSSQIVTVGGGFNTYEQLPLNYETTRSYTQSIYLQSELNIADGNINNLAFYLTDDLIMSGANQWKIYLGHTDKTEFSTNSDWLLTDEGLTEVANVTLDNMLSAGWVNIELTNPFAYNNVDNLIVGTIEYSSGIVEDPAYLYTVETNSNRSLTYGYDSIYFSPNISYSGEISSSISKINFTFRQGRIYGVIKNSQNQVISNANISIAEFGNFLSNDFGEFEVDNIGAGLYQITISAPWYETQNIEVQVIDSEENYLEIILLEELIPASDVSTTLAKDYASVTIRWEEPTLNRGLNASKKATNQATKTKVSSLQIQERGERTIIPIVSFNLYRYRLEDADNQEEWIEVASDIWDLSYTDYSFQSLELGSYYWAVETVYFNNRLAEPAISGEVVKYSYLENSIPDQIDFGSIPFTHESAYHEIALINFGNGPLTISEISCDDSAFNIVYDEQALLVDVDSTFIIEVNFAPEAPGAYLGELSVRNNSSNHPDYLVTLSGVCEYLQPAIPENLQISMIGHNANISWDPVTEDISQNPITPDYYLVFYNEVNSSAESDYYCLGNTTDLNYTHDTAETSSDFIFYKVKACVDVDNIILNGINELLLQKGKVSLEEVERMIKTIQLKPTIPVSKP